MKNTIFGAVALALLPGVAFAQSQGWQQTYLGGPSNGGIQHTPQYSEAKLDPYNALMLPPVAFASLPTTCTVGRIVYVQDALSGTETAGNGTGNYGQCIATTVGSQTGSWMVLGSASTALAH